jgi:hypothetical protein
MVDAAVLQSALLDFLLLLPPPPLLLLLLSSGPVPCSRSAGHWGTADGQLLHTLHHLHGEH